ncbi:MAG: hydrogenase maturation protease [Nannocystaceae bacterium]
MSGASRVRVIALGSPHGGDDEAALELAAALREGADAAALEVIAAGRPGPGLVDLLDVQGPVLLLDVVRSGAAPGTIHELELDALVDASLAQAQVSSHGFGPAEALRLAAALGRALPPGRFVGVEGASFTVGAPRSPAVAAAQRGFTRAARRAIDRLRRGSTKGDEHA